MFFRGMMFVLSVLLSSTVYSQLDGDFHIIGSVSSDSDIAHVLNLSRKKIVTGKKGATEAEYKRNVLSKISEGIRARVVTKENGKTTCKLHKKVYIKIKGGIREHALKKQVSDPINILPHEDVVIKVLPSYISAKAKSWGCSDEQIAKLDLSEASNTFDKEGFARACDKYLGSYTNNAFTRIGVCSPKTPLMESGSFAADMASLGATEDEAYDKNRCKHAMYGELANSEFGKWLKAKGQSGLKAGQRKNQNIDAWSTASGIRKDKDKIDKGINIINKALHNIRQSYCGPVNDTHKIILDYAKANKNPKKGKSKMDVFPEGFFGDDDLINSSDPKVKKAAIAKRNQLKSKLDKCVNTTTVDDTKSLEEKEHKITFYSMKKQCPLFKNMIIQNSIAADTILEKALIAADMYPLALSKTFQTAIGIDRKGLEEQDKKGKFKFGALLDSCLQTRPGEKYSRTGGPFDLGEYDIKMKAETLKSKLGLEDHAVDVQLRTDKPSKDKLANARKIIQFAYKNEIKKELDKMKNQASGAEKSAKKYFDNCCSGDSNRTDKNVIASCNELYNDEETGYYSWYGHLMNEPHVFKLAQTKIQKNLEDNPDSKKYSVAGLIEDKNGKMVYKRENRENLGEGDFIAPLCFAAKKMKSDDRLKDLAKGALIGVGAVASVAAGVATGGMSFALLGLATATVAGEGAIVYKDYNREYNKMTREAVILTLDEDSINFNKSLEAQSRHLYTLDGLNTEFMSILALDLGLGALADGYDVYKMWSGVNDTKKLAAFRKLQHKEDSKSAQALDYFIAKRKEAAEKSGEKFDGDKIWAYYYSLDDAGRTALVKALNKGDKTSVDDILNSGIKIATVPKEIVGSAPLEKRFAKLPPDQQIMISSTLNQADPKTRKFLVEQFEEGELINNMRSCTVRNKNPVLRGTTFAGVPGS